VVHLFHSAATAEALGLAAGTPSSGSTGPASGRLRPARGPAALLLVGAADAAALARLGQALRLAAPAAPVVIWAGQAAGAEVARGALGAGLHGARVPYLVLRAGGAQPDELHGVARGATARVRERPPGARQRGVAGRLGDPVRGDAGVDDQRVPADAGVGVAGVAAARARERENDCRKDEAAQRSPGAGVPFSRRSRYGCAMRTPAAMMVMMLVNRNASNDLIPNDHATIQTTIPNVRVTRTIKASHPGLTSRAP
jgi:hypothetical protein